MGPASSERWLGALVRRKLLLRLCRLLLNRLHPSGLLLASRRSEGRRLRTERRILHSALYSARGSRGTLHLRVYTCDRLQSGLVGRCQQTATIRARVVDESPLVVVL